MGFLYEFCEYFISVTQKKIVSRLQIYPKILEVSSNTAIFLSDGPCFACIASADAQGHIFILFVFYFCCNTGKGRRRRRIPTFV